MSDGTNIEWTDATWNVVVGCDKVSPGCDHCYAIRTAHRMQGNPNPKVSEPYAGTESGGEWTGRVNLVEDRLSLPLRWRRPRRIFVNAQSDLFHDSVPDEYIARVFAVMAYAYRHTFQILTKRHARMRSLLSSERFVDLFDIEFCKLPDWAPRWPDPDDAGHLMDGPLRNVWLGVSAENQQWADIRIPALLDTPAAVRFVSAEPLLGAIDLRQSLRRWTPPDEHPSWQSAIPPFRTGLGVVNGGIATAKLSARDVLHWVIVGGESGRGARPMHPAWARSLRDQCQTAGVPFLFKQWGEFAPGRHPTGRRGGLVGKGWHSGPVVDGRFTGEYATVSRVGKKAAGRELDGRTWDEFPEAVTA